MTVREIMTTEVSTCTTYDDLATAARIMHDRRCGFVPVVDNQGHIAGVLTDRDVCLRAAEYSRPISRIAVTDAMSRPVVGCGPADNLKVTLQTMAAHHVRRLPVLDEHGRLQGVVSIDDVTRATRRRGSPTALEIVAALKKITEASAVTTVSA